MRGWSSSNPATLCCSTIIKTGEWPAMYMCLKSIEFAPFLLDIRTDSMVYQVFHLMSSKSQTTILKTLHTSESSSNMYPSVNRGVGSFYSTCGTRHVAVVTNLVIRHKWGKDWVVITTNNHSCWQMLSLALPWKPFSISGYCPLHPQFNKI